MKVSLPDIDPKSRATAINALLSAGKIDLFKSESGLLYRDHILCSAVVRLCMFCFCCLY